MMIDDKLIKFIFSGKSIRSYFTILLLIGVVLFIVLIIVVERFQSATAGLYLDKLHRMENYESADIRLLCAITSCKKAYIEFGDKHFEFDRDSNKMDKIKIEDMPRKVYGHMSNGLNSLVEYKNFTFVVNDDVLLELCIELFIILYTALAMLYTYIFYVFSKNAYKKSQQERSYYKNYIENKSQRDITETLHHEMAIPIAIIRTLTGSLYRTVFNNENCDYRRAYDSTIREDMSNIVKALDRLDSVLLTLKGSKQIKNTDQETSIYDILHNIVNTVQCFNIGRITPDYKNMNLMQSYRVDKITNGMFLNMIQIMVNNSIEANASIITFTFEVNRDAGYLTIKDNGRGIRDKNDNIIKDTEYIYTYGYSTKNKDGTPIKQTSVFQKLLGKLGVKIYTTSNIRGIGLNLNKEILYKVGGNIVVLSTSPAGTTFKLTLPVKKLTVNKDIKS